MGDRMDVYIYPNNPDDDNLANEALSALISALSSTEDHFASHGEVIDWKVVVDKSYPSMKEEWFNLYKPDKAIVLTDFQLWLNGQGINDTGVHLLVTSSWDGGLSRSTLGSAWQDKNEAVVGQQKDKIAHFKNISIQEVYHSFINIGGLFGSSILSDNEHELGEIMPEGPANTPKVTPMVDSYVEEGLAARGKCNRTSNSYGHTTTLSSCTQDAVVETYQNQ